MLTGYDTASSPRSTLLHTQITAGLFNIIIKVLEFRGAFAKIAKTDYQFRHVCLPVCPSTWNKSARTARIFMTFDTGWGIKISHILKRYKKWKKLSRKKTVYRVSQEEWTKLQESVPYVELYRYKPKHLYPKFNGYGDNGHRKVWASGVSTYCTPSVTPYSSTAHARQPDTAS